MLSFLKKKRLLLLSTHDEMLAFEKYDQFYLLSMVPTGDLTLMRNYASQLMWDQRISLVIDGNVALRVTLMLEWSVYHGIIYGR